MQMYLKETLLPLYFTMLDSLTIDKLASQFEAECNFALEEDMLHFQQ